MIEGILSCKKDEEEVMPTLLLALCSTSAPAVSIEGLVDAAAPPSALGLKKLISPLCLLMIESQGQKGAKWFDLFPRKKKKY